MKKRIIIMLLACIQLLFFLPIMRVPFYLSHDGPLHVARFAAYVLAIQDGNFPPRWAGHLNYGYGTPVLDFFGPLAGYLAAGLHFLNFDLTTAFKIIIGGSFIAAPISFFVWSNSFTASLLYGLSPYVFLDVFVRGDIGEMLAFAFLPLIFSAIDRLETAQKRKYVIIGAVILMLLILSHNGMSLLFIPILMAYGFVNVPKKNISSFVLMLVTALGLSAFFWIPALADQKYINAQLFSSMYRQHFLQLTSLIFKPWGFGTDINSSGGLSPQIGILQFVLILLAIMFAFRAKVKKKIFFFWIFIFLMSMLLTTSNSQFFWERLPILQKLQFPWRFMALSTFSGVALITWLLYKVRANRISALIIILTLLTSIPIVKIQKPINILDADAFHHEGTTALHGEATTIWTAGDPASTAAKPIQIIAGKGNIRSYIRKNSWHTFTTQSDQVINILDNTLYFPGWKAYVDGGEIPIEFQDSNHRGLMTFFVPAGNHEIKVSFQETGLRQLANMISLLSLGFAIVLLQRSLIINT